MDIPNRCIWCHKKPPVIAFDESHVVPECVGNKDQHVLPAGVVCKSCNNYFGSKIEPALLSDPHFHVMAVVMQIQGAGDLNTFRERVFDHEHAPVDSVRRDLNLAVKLENNSVALNVRYSIQGTIKQDYCKRNVSR